MALFEYKSAHLGNIAEAIYLFNVCLRHRHSVLSSNDRSETKILRLWFLLDIFKKFVTK